jgi:ATP-dependent RNA helicase DHX8/PRP22
VKKAALNREGSLKVLVTSATLNVTLFKTYFNDCPWIKVHGKSFPVEVKFSESPVNAAKRI